MRVANTVNEVLTATPEVTKELAARRETPDRRRRSRLTSPSVLTRPVGAALRALASSLCITAGWLSETGADRARVRRCAMLPACVGGRLCSCVCCGGTTLISQG